MRAVFTGKKNPVIHQYAIGNATVCGKVFRSSLWVILSDQDTSYGPATCKACEDIRAGIAEFMDRAGLEQGSHPALPEGVTLYLPRQQGRER